MEFRSRKGFTLIELLVVIAIIAILAAILFPVFAKARSKARQTVCLSNCKQMGMGVQMYCDDYDNYLPPRYIETSAPVPNGQNYPGWAGWWCWNQEIYGYVKNNKMFYCPDNPKGTDENNVYAIYGLNLDLTDAGLGTTGNLTNIEYAATTFFIADSSQYTFSRTQLYDPYYSHPTSYIPGMGGAGYSDFVKLVSPELQSDAMSGRHNGMINIVFADGHASGVQAAKVVSQAEKCILRMPNAFEGTADSL